MRVVVARHDDRLAEIAQLLLHYVLDLLEVLGILGAVMLGCHLRHVVRKGGSLLLLLPVVGPGLFLPLPRRLPHVDRACVPHLGEQDELAWRRPPLG